MIPLVKDTIDKQDIDELIAWLRTYPRLTKGDLTLEYEKKWSEILGCKYSVFVNSGSSAVLLMIYSLLESGQLKKDDTIVVPAVAWATDLAPIFQLGLKPVLCDCNMEDLSIDLQHFEEIIDTYSPSALILVSVLGMVPQMDMIVDICNRHKIILLEDSCESTDSKFRSKKLGTFGLMSSFSTYFGHHISTIEGGMVCTNDENLFNILKALRSHGWDRDMDPKYQNKMRKKYNIKDFEALYKFYYNGFNLRATDLQAKIGLGQLEKLSLISKKRNENFKFYDELIINPYWKPGKQKENFISNLAYPVIHPKREEIVHELMQNGVEVRPLICGSLARQPFWTRMHGHQELKNADIIDKYGFYLPNNHQITEKEIKFICNIVNKALSI